MLDYNGVFNDIKCVCIAHNKYNLF